MSSALVRLCAVAFLLALAAVVLVNITTDTDTIRAALFAHLP